MNGNAFGRSAGILLHITSLPGCYGIGDLGPAAHAMVDLLARARQRWWQVLPLGLTGYGDSPYQSFSAFAGNPFLISPELLVSEGLLQPTDVAGSDFPADLVHFETVIPFKERVTAQAWENFKSGAARKLAEPFETFCTEQAAWLDDFSLFMSLKETHGKVSWQHWPSELRLREPNAIAHARQNLQHQCGMHKFRQFLFFSQWQALQQYAGSRGIGFIGDMPIFVATDSADVWAEPDLFQLDGERRPTVVAGVPPDYFSATGQLWGNPLYDWEAHRKSRYAWWVARMSAALKLVDLIRLDHFRGFEAAWAIPAGSPTAETGRWLPGPGAEFFQVLRDTVGDLPLIAEDLGVITPEVDALRTRFGLPGMRILQFAFGGAREDRFLPHNYDKNTVVYTGTHDNDTTVGWFHTLTPDELHFFRRYVPGTKDAAWDLIQLAWASVANLALAPLQDVLSLATEARMNVPGVPSGNWRWRLNRDLAGEDVIARLGEMTVTYARAQED
jgi:4-alpha-glucanotransferase